MILENVGRPGWDPSIETALAAGAYRELRAALAMRPEQVVHEVRLSGLRGRGGAGFPTGVKWGFIPTDGRNPVHLICNADESEPGTFKDRAILHLDPHQLLEGMIIAAHAVGARSAFIYIRGEFTEGARILERAIAEARARGFVGPDSLGSGRSLEIVVHRGAGAYICGEETGLIESIEGRRPYPRIKPPFYPATCGLYLHPTAVNNVETLCHVKHVIRLGGAGYARIGTRHNTGTRIACVSGDVARPGLFEVELGKVTVGELIHEMAGGPRPGRRIKAVIPGGSSAPVWDARERFRLPHPHGDARAREVGMEEIPIDFDSIAAAGSMAGSAGFIVIDDSRDMVEVLHNLNAFYAHESCGQCTPCREGSLWMEKLTRRLLRGEGVPDDADTLVSIADAIAGRTICAFGEACALPTRSVAVKFRDEFERARDRAPGGRAPTEREIALAGVTGPDR